MSLFKIREGFKQSLFIPTPPLTEKTIPDQSGRVFIVTGSNTGVGYHVASILYGANGKVYVATRSESKAEAAITSIKKQNPNSKGSLHFLELNLSDLNTIKGSVNEFLSKEQKLHWINNNAGVMVPPKGSQGSQGIDLQYQTNVLGPFVFTKLLLPLLTKTAESEPIGTVRTSWAGSGVLLNAPPRGTVWKKDARGLDTLEDNLPLWDVYSVSKTANYYLGAEFGRRNPKSRVLHNSYNPGNLNSDLQRHMNPILAWIMRLLLHPPIFGAYTELYAGLANDLTIEADQGSYIVPWGRKTIPRPDLAAEVEKGASGEAAKVYEWADRITQEYQ